ncbi:MAG: hypothetical protein IJ379_00715 [Lachnospiraceae bacterium]|nr:hypothetical protein [Lachnospiraceae bacterium]
MNLPQKHYGFADEHSESDLLGGNKYYDGLSKFIMNCATPMTISIQGDWGTGKTTALNLIQKKIESDPTAKCKILWFRTWQYSKFGMDNNMTLALMTHLYDKLETLGKDKGRPTEHLKLPFKRILSKTASGIVSTLATENLGNSTETVMNYLLGIDNIVDVSRQIEDAKSKIQESINSIVKDDERLVIFIDDLDRLEPQTAIELLEGLKIFLDCKRCVYVLAIDADVVYQGVKSKYGSEFGEEKSKKYFDKIIQVPFNLPVNQYNLEAYVNQFLTENDAADKYVQVIMKLLGCNPRSIKRAFNLLQLNELIMTENIKNAQDKLDLFTIILFQVKDETGYANLVNAAKKSSEDVLTLLNSEDYTLIKEALNLESASDDDEHWINFIELLVNTSRIALSSVNSSEMLPTSFTKQEDYLIRIIEQMNTSLIKEQVTNELISYFDASNNKLCSFNTKNGGLNIIIYKKAGTDSISMPTYEGLVYNTQKDSADDSQLGYYHNKSSHITLVNVHKCKNTELIDNIMTYYGLF